MQHILDIVDLGLMLAVVTGTGIVTMVLLRFTRA